MKSIIKSFFRKKNTEVAPQPSPLSQQQIVQEIHETFYTEVDRLLADALTPSSTITDKQHLLEKRQRLIRAGFGAAKDVKDLDVEVERLRLAQKHNNDKAQLAEAINYFSFKYPNYKFITEESVKRICEKYGLVYGDASRYTGTVPDFNLAKIEEFKIDPKDECWSFSWGRDGLKLFHCYCGSDKRIIDIDDYEDTRYGLFEKLPLEIAAPAKDFDLTNAKISGNRVEVIFDDPIVLKPVFFKGKKHYLIVTAWGLEASDELVVNQKMN